MNGIKKIYKINDRITNILILKLKDFNTKIKEASLSLLKITLLFIGTLHRYTFWIWKFILLGYAPICTTHTHTY